MAAIVKIGFFAFVLIAFACCVVAFDGLSEHHCEVVGKLIEREKNGTLPQLEALVKTYFPPATIAEAKGLKTFFQNLDGRSICQQAISCGADLGCTVRRLLQGVGDAAFSTPGLKMDTFKHCNRCKALLPAVRMAARQDIVTKKLKKSARSTCTLLYSGQECALHFNKWFNSYYQKFIDLLTASTTCADLKLCSAANHTVV